MARALTLLVYALIAWFVVSGVRRFFHRQKLRRMGDVQYATVTSVMAVGSRIDAQPDIMFTLQYTGADGNTYHRNVTRNFNIGQLPRRGDRMTIWVNPTDPSDFDIASKEPIPPGFDG